MVYIKKKNYWKLAKIWKTIKKFLAEKFCQILGLLDLLEKPRRCSMSEVTSNTTALK